MGDLDACDAPIDAAYPYVASPADMSKWHREWAYVDIERGHLELAAVHLVASTIFGEPDPALGQLAYSKARYGRDFSNMDGDAAVALLDAHGRPLGPDPTTVSALVDLLALLREDGRRQEAAQVAGDVYGLTGAEPVGQLAELLRS